MNIILSFEKDNLVQFELNGSSSTSVLKLEIKENLTTTSSPIGIERYKNGSYNLITLHEEASYKVFRELFNKDKLYKKNHGVKLYSDSSYNDLLINIRENIYLKFYEENISFPVYKLRGNFSAITADEFARKGISYYNNYLFYLDNTLYFNNGTNYYYYLNYYNMILKDEIVTISNNMTIYASKEWNEIESILFYDATIITDRNRDEVDDILVTIYYKDYWDPVFISIKDLKQDPRFMDNISFKYIENYFPYDLRIEVYYKDEIYYRDRVEFLFDSDN